MKTQISLSVAFLLAVGVLFAPQAAQAQAPLVLVPPCNAASLIGGFGYELRGSILNEVDVRTQVGRLNFDGAGHFTNTFTQSIFFVTSRWQVSQGTYTISSDCKSARLIFHGGYDPEDCVHFDVTFGATAVSLGVPGGAPPVVVLVTDGKLACTDDDAQRWDPIKKTYSSTYTGTLAQQ